MRERGYGALVWGGLLILLGLLLLIDNLELMGDWDVPVLSLMLGALGMIFLAIFVNDRAQWWALIPGLVILGIAVAVFLAERDLVPDFAVATIILAGVGLPFLLIFFTDRQHWWVLVPAMTMGGIAMGIFFEGIGAIGEGVVGGFVVGGISLGFLSIYLIDRKQWWALVPGGAMGIVAFFFVFGNGNPVHCAGGDDSVGTAVAPRQPGWGAPAGRSSSQRVSAAAIQQRERTVRRQTSASQSHRRSGDTRAKTATDA